MILHPTVIIGFGSTGKYVISSAEKFLYEVLNGEQLKLFKFLVFETAINQQEQATVAHTRPVDIKVQDIGASYFTFKQNLRDEFTWCPTGMHCDGPGAGNKRAGGRLMFFQHIEVIRDTVEKALAAVMQAATDNLTTNHINALLGQRGGSGQGHPGVNPMAETQ